MIRMNVDRADSVFVLDQQHDDVLIAVESFAEYVPVQNQMTITI